MLAAPAHAHFQMLYTPETALNGGQATEFLLLFTHPAHGGPDMAMAEPEDFYVLSQRGEAADVVRTDLSEYLEAIDWQSEQGMTAAYTAALPRNVTRSLGDYVFVLQPGPYYEPGEDKYIQQFTKTLLNIGGVPGNWGPSP